LLEIDWQGAHQVRRLFPESKQIFILPPSQFDLRERLSNRGTDTVDVIEHRLSCAVEDMQQYSNFDYNIINDDFNKALHDLEAVIIANRLTSSQQANRHEKLIQQLITPTEQCLKLESIDKAFYTVQSVKIYYSNENSYGTRHR